MSKVVICSNFIKDSDYMSRRIYQWQTECTWSSQNRLDNKQAAQVINKCDLSVSKATKENKFALKATTFHHAHCVPWAKADPGCSSYCHGDPVPPAGTGTPQHKWPLEALSRFSVTSSFTATTAQSLSEWDIQHSNTPNSAGPSWAKQPCQLKADTSVKKRPKYHW